MGSIFYDVRNDMSENINFLVIIGGRGIGKTYSALQWLQEKPGGIYLRNQADELDLCTSFAGNPFKKLNKDMGWNYEFVRKGGITTYGDFSDEEKSNAYGYGFALARTGKLKGFDLSDCTRMVYDEFIPDPDLILRFDEGDALMRFYETVNRNREILGEKALQTVMLSNATQINSSVLRSLNIDDVVEWMVRTGQKRFTEPARGIRIVLPECKELVLAKGNTALYRAAGKESKFSRNALNNEFTSMSLQNVVKRKIIEYKPLCSYEDMYIYKHKSRTEYYVTNIYSDVESYSELDTKELFLRRWYPYRDMMLNGTFKFSSYLIKKRFLSLFFKNI